MLIEEILNRIRDKENVESDADLARALGVSAGRLSNWKRRNTIPLDVLSHYTDKKKIHLAEIIFGTQIDSSLIQKIPDKYLLYYKQLYIILDEGTEDQRTVVKTILEGVCKGIMENRKILDVLAKHGEALEKLSEDVKIIKEVEDVTSVSTPRRSK